MTDTKEITKNEESKVEKVKRFKTELPVVDIYENKDGLVLYADMPGVGKEDISVNIEDGTLTLSGLRRFDENNTGTWKEFFDVKYIRSFSVPKTIDVEKVEAELKNGVLTLHLPKVEAAKPKSIEIKAA